MSGAELQITFLGTGSSIPANDRQQSSFVLKHAQGLVMFDCGEGTQYALRKLGISTRREMVIWISHLHSDHFLGLPGLLSSFQLLGRTQPVKIVGPTGLSQTVHNMLLANYVKTEYEINVIELHPGDQFHGDGYVLQTIGAAHEANALSVKWVENEIPGKVNMAQAASLNIPQGPLIGKLQAGEDIVVEGRRIKPEEVIGEPRRGRTVFFSGDTAYNEKLIEILQNCDLLVHEATYPSDMVDLARERDHTTVKQAVELAKKAQVKRLVLTHLSPRIQDLDGELASAKKIFEHVVFAYQGYRVTIPYLYHDD